MAKFHRPMFLKARLHLEFLLRYLVRFSSSDVWKRVDELWYSEPYSSMIYPHLNIHNSSSHLHPSEEENRSKNYKCKRALKCLSIKSFQSRSWFQFVDYKVYFLNLPHTCSAVTMIKPPLLSADDFFPKTSTTCWKYHFKRWIWDRLDKSHCVKVTYIKDFSVHICWVYVKLP